MHPDLKHRGAVTLSDDDKSVIIRLARELTGTHVNDGRTGVIFLNVTSRIEHLGCKSLAEYLSFVNRNEKEVPNLLSALTIHTTGWFREPMSFDQFQTIASDFARKNPMGTFKLLSIGCSSGEEVYSYAFVLEELRRIFPSFSYKITGVDIDPVSLSQGRSATYPRVKIDFIEDRWRPLVLRRLKHDETLKVESTVSNCVEFRSANILQMHPFDEKFDFISCRNILIYFDPGQIDSIISKIIQMLKPDGHFCTGVSETGVVNRPELKSLGSTIFRSSSRTNTRNISKPLTAQTFIQTASQVKDVEPQTNDSTSPLQTTSKKYDPDFDPEVIAFGSSTGGTEILIRILDKIPQPCPPIIVVQHIVPDFAADFATRLSEKSGLILGKIQDGEILKPGHLYMALNDYHIMVRKSGGVLRLGVSHAEAIASHRPSVDFLFNSLSQHRIRTVAILLTGMGRDGADGMVKIHKQGGFTMAQDESSSTVFGMPGEAIKLGAVDYIGNPRQIQCKVHTILNRKKTAA